MPAKGGISNRRKYHDCPQCGKSFYGSPKKYCSDECCLAAGKNLPKRTGATKECAICQKQFYVPRGRVDAICCSIECGNKWQGRNKVEIVCKVCGMRYKVSPAFMKFGNPKYCSIACRDNDPETYERLNVMNVMQQTLKPNKLEQLGYSILDSLNIPYTKQFSIAGKFVVDACFESQRVIVQFDGDYWHYNPAKFSLPDRRQKRRVSIDASQNRYFAKCGYTVLRFWESDIHSQPDLMKQSVLDALR